MKTFLFIGLLLLGYQLSYAQAKTDKPKKYYRLVSGESLRASYNDTLFSPDRSYFMTLQNNKRLIIAKTKDKSLVWKHKKRGHQLLFENGELKFLKHRRRKKIAKWRSNTSGCSACKLVLGNFGALIIKNERNEIIWPVPAPKGSNYNISNPVQSGSGELTIGYTNTKEAGQKMSLPATNYYGQTFLSPKGLTGTIEQCNITIKRHPDEPLRGVLYIDFYKIAQKADDNGEMVLEYLGSSNSIGNPQGNIRAHFESPIELAPDTEYAFIVRPSGFQKYALVADTGRYPNGSLVAYEPMGDSFPSKGKSLSVRTDFVADLYFEIQMIVK